MTRTLLCSIGLLVLVLLVGPGCQSAGTAGEAGAGGSGAPGGSGASGGDPATGATGGGGGTLPGAAGTGFGSFGQDTPGGLEGQVIKVTTLDAQGAGSLAEAIGTSGPRVIVFEVGGVIDLARGSLEVTEPFVTIAGQTAPSPGISILRGGMTVRTHDVRIEHIRFRMGDAGASAGVGFEPDVTTQGSAAYNIVFDHLSVAWGVDENLSVSGDRFSGPEGTSRNVTISNSIIAEGLDESVHEKGGHSMGTLIHDYCSDVAVVGNLYAHNDERNPWFKGFATGVIVNNVIYNPGAWVMRLGPVDSEWAGQGAIPEGPRVSVVGNFLQHGVDTPPGLAMVSTNSRGSAFIDDNLALLVEGEAAPLLSPVVTELSERPAWPMDLEARPASEVVDWVVAHAGARPRDRDAVDQRILDDFANGSGSIIDSQEDVGGYPAPEPTERSLEVPGEDILGWLRDLAAELE